MNLLTSISTPLVLILCIFVNFSDANTCTCTTTSGTGNGICRAATSSCSTTTGAEEVCPCNAFDVANCPTGTLECVSIDTATLSDAEECRCRVNQPNQLNSLCVTSEQGNQQCPTGEFCPCTFRNVQGSTCSNQKPNCVAFNPGQGMGDPHFNGFDGSKFDFHGENNHTYIIFAERDGDVFSAMTRSTDEFYHGVRKSYFEQFGLIMSGSSRKLHFKTIFQNGKWVLKVLLDGKHITGPVTSKLFRITHPSKQRVAVRTDKSTVEVFGVSMGSNFRHHLDFKITKTNRVKRSDRFGGILGITMAHKLRQSVNGFPESLGKMRPSYIETSLRMYCESTSLFPSAGEVETFLDALN